MPSTKRRHRKSKSDRPRKLNANGRNVCAICGSATKHRPTCMNLVRPSPPDTSIGHEISASRHQATDHTIESNDLILDTETSELESDSTVAKYIHEVWEKKKGTLPKLKGFKKVEGTLDRSVWPSWKFSTPDPFLRRVGFHKEVEFLVGCVDVYVFCPHTFWPHFMSSHTMTCPACKSTEGISFHGWNHTIRKVIDIASNRYIISRRYRHRNCKEAVRLGKTSSVFTSLHPQFLQGLPEIVSAQLDVVIYSKTMFSRDMKVYAREMQQVCSFRSAASVHKVLHNTKRAYMEKMYLLAMQEIRRPGNRFCLISSRYLNHTLDAPYT
jgi:hypothetical protein